MLDLDRWDFDVNPSYDAKPLDDSHIPEWIMSCKEYDDFVRSKKAPHFLSTITEAWIFTYVTVQPSCQSGWVSYS